jgi:HEAT repeat protein
VFGGEPRHKGLPLDYWVTRLKQGNQKEQAEAREAMRIMGASAVPYLEELLVKQDSPTKLWLLKNYGKRFPYLYRVMPRTLDHSRAYAAAALGEMGPAASNAIPALMQLAKRNEPLLSSSATAAVMRIRGESMSPLLQALENTNSANWQAVAMTLAEFGTNARPAVPVLCRALKSRNPQVYDMAAYALGYIHSDASIAVPALISAVMEGKLGNTIWALGQFESEARSARPYLSTLQYNPDPMVRQSVLMALRRILPPDEVETLVPLLIKCAADPDPNLSGAAKGLLREINPAAAAKAGVK